MCTEEGKRKISEKAKGNKRWLGKHHTEETKRKLREIAKHRKPISEETRKKMSLANKGRVSFRKGKRGIYSEETLKKMSLANKGRGKGIPKSEEHKRKQSKIMKENYKTGKIKIHRGKEHWSWKGGQKRPIVIVRHSPEYIRWREEVFQRDNYKCIMCGDSKGGNLEADHKTPLSCLVDILVEKLGKDKLYTDILKHPSLWDINNGQTLCTKCHKKTESYGKHTNTKTYQVIL